MTTASFFASITNRFQLLSRSFAALKEKRIVSKPQSKSKLRLVKVISQQDETPAERSYRSQYESLQKWNDNYWAENNELFDRKKFLYIETNFGDSITKEEALSHDQLAPFYRSFLEENRVRHMNYNKIWYRNHSALLSSALKAKVSRLKETLSMRTGL